MARLGGLDFMPEDLGSPAFELVRSAVAVWELRIGQDRRFTLPAGARDLGLVPAGANELIGMVAFRGVIELWHPADLRARLQDSAARWAELKAHPGTVNP